MGLPTLTQHVGSTSSVGVQTVPASQVQDPLSVPSIAHYVEEVLVVVVFVLIGRFWPRKNS